jgi:HEAT repeat protein
MSEEPPTGKVPPSSGESEPEDSGQDFSEPPGSGWHPEVQRCARASVLKPATSKSQSGVGGDIGPSGGSALDQAVQAGYLGDSSSALDHSFDPDPAVREAAFGSLGRIGPLDRPTLLRAMGDSAPRVRRRACELAVSLEDASLLDDLASMLSDASPLVVEAAAWAIGEVTGHLIGLEALGDGTGLPGVQHVSDATLARVLDALSTVATSHSDPLCREAAVAALGAIGDERGLPAVLGALEDRPAVRRRAVVALAAFDDPSADRAMESCLADRDWQVREIAERLTEDPGE